MALPWEGDDRPRVVSDRKRKLISPETDVPFDSANLDGMDASREDLRARIRSTRGPAAKSAKMVGPKKALALAMLQQQGIPVHHCDIGDCDYWSERAREVIGHKAAIEAHR